MPPSVNPALCTMASMRSNACSVARTAPRAPCFGAEIAQVGDGLPARAVDGRDDFVGRAGIGTRAEELGAGVAHDDQRAPRRAQQRVGATDASPGAGDQHDPIVEAEFVHGVRLLGEAAVLAHVATQAARHRVAPVLHAHVVPHDDVARSPLVDVARRVGVEMARSAASNGSLSSRLMPATRSAKSLTNNARRPVCGCAVNTGCIASDKRGSSDGGGRRGSK